MYSFDYSTDSEIWVCGESNLTLMQAIKACKEKVKIDTDLEFRIMYQNKTSFYHIGTITSKGWKRDVYKMFNALEDELHKAEWNCPIPETKVELKNSRGDWKKACIANNFHPSWTEVRAAYIEVKRLRIERKLNR